jgi:hypothetical protein
LIVNGEVGHDKIKVNDHKQRLWMSCPYKGFLCLILDFKQIFCIFCYILPVRSRGSSPLTKKFMRAEAQLLTSLTGNEISKAYPIVVKSLIRNIYDRLKPLCVTV